MKTTWGKLQANVERNDGRYYAYRQTDYRILERKKPARYALSIKTEDIGEIFGNENTTRIIGKLIGGPDWPGGYSEPPVSKFINLETYKFTNLYKVSKFINLET